jgi:hypothetical protein
MAETLELFGTALAEIADGPHVGSSHASLTEALMRRLAEKGATLDHLCDRKMMKRSRATLEARARQFGIAFPDYVPMALRKTLSFVQRGDYFELRGDDVRAVAKLLEIVVVGKPDEPMCAVPCYSIDPIREQLRGAFYIVKLTRQKPKRNSKKVSENAH